MIFLCALFAAASPALAGVGPGAPPPVVVVDEPAAIRAAVGFEVDGTYIATAAEAEAPRQDLVRYLEAERRRERSATRQFQMRRIEVARDRYLWHCGGYLKDGQKYLFCSFVRYEPSALPQLRQKAFPVIFDGGVSVCRCYYSRKIGRIIRVEWNAEV